MARVSEDILEGEPFQPVCQLITAEDRGMGKWEANCGETENNGWAKGKNAVETREKIRKKSYGEIGCLRESVGYSITCMRNVLNQNKETELTGRHLNFCKYFTLFSF